MHSLNFCVKKSARKRLVLQYTEILNFSIFVEKTWKLRNSALKINKSISEGDGGVNNGGFVVGKSEILLNIQL